MKKLLLVFGMLVGAGSIVIAGGLVLATRAVGKSHREFFEIVARENADAMLAEAVPELLDEIDAPVLAAWMQHVNQTLGAYQSTDLDGYKFETHADAGGNATQVFGVSRFERGSARVQLTFRNGLLAGFNIESDEIGSGWFNGPTDTSLYRARALGFYRDFIDGNVAGVSERMHEGLRKIVSDSELKETTENIGSWTGENAQVELIDDVYVNANVGELMINLKLKGNAGDADATVSFQFDGMRGHLIAFHIKPLDRK